MSKNISKNQRKWTIGIVNFHSIVYLHFITKTLYSFNDPQDFKLIIIDNSNPHETGLENLLAQYKKYENIEVIYHTPKANFPSGQHGESLDIILEKTDTPFLMVQDPDFFWVRRNYLKILEDYFAAGYAAIGAPYRTDKKITDGDRNFPTAFGCAIQTKYLAGVDFYPSEDLQEIKDLGRDVGWKIREKLSKEKFLSFEQKQSQIYKSLGEFSYDVNPYSYYADGRRIAYHLFKGSRGNIIPKNAKKKKGYDGTNLDGYDKEDIIDIGYIRKKYGSFFYNEAKYSETAIGTTVLKLRAPLKIQF